MCPKNTALTLIILILGIIVTEVNKRLKTVNKINVLYT